MPDQWYEILEKLLGDAAMLRYCPPLSLSTDVQALPFGPYLDLNGVWKFRTSIRFQTTKIDISVRNLRALAPGLITYEVGLNNGPGRIILTLFDIAPAAIISAAGALPGWYPKKLIAIYGNVDPVEAKAAAARLFLKPDNSKDDKKRARTIKAANKYGNVLSDSTSVQQLVNLWSQNQLKSGLSVEAGQVIGACAKDESANAPLYFTELQMVESVDAPLQLFLNPSYFFVLWNEREWIKEPLYDVLKDANGVPAGTGNVFLIQGGVTGSITTAIGQASAGDTIVILDKKTYYEKVVIDKPISLTSIGAHNAKINATDYPTLSGLNVPGGIPTHRPITIKNVNTGIAHVGKLIIEKGLADGTSVGSRGNGGGILVENANNVIISSCLIHDCTAHEPSGDSYFGEGFGGGISVYHSSPGILGCYVYENNAEGRGAGIGIYGYGWPTIHDCFILNNGKVSIGPGSRKDGGGIAIQIAVPDTETVKVLLETSKANLSTLWKSAKLTEASSKRVRISTSIISGNHAFDDGGGVYVSVGSGVLMRVVIVSKNSAVSNGGGIRLSLGSRLVLQACTIKENSSNSSSTGVHNAVDESGTAGGGIAARNSELDVMKGTRIMGNTAFGWAGGGIYIISSDEGPTLTPAVAAKLFVKIGQASFNTDFNDILWTVFRFEFSKLYIDGTCTLQNNNATQLAGQGNHGKGGALYGLRNVGYRDSKLAPPPDKDRAGKLVALPILIRISKTQTVLGSGNTASYQGSNRFYLEDMSILDGNVSTVLKDDAIASAESAGTDFSYP